MNVLRIHGFTASGARLSLLPRLPPLARGHPRRAHTACNVRTRAAAPGDAHSGYEGGARDSGNDSDDSGGDAADGGHAYSANVFEALPPPPNVGRKRQVAALVAGALIEFTVTGENAESCSCAACQLGWALQRGAFWPYPLSAAEPSVDRSAAPPLLMPKPPLPQRQAASCGRRCWRHWL